MRSVSIVGIGRLGGALAPALSRAGYQVENLIYRSNVPEDIAGLISPSPNLIAFDDLQVLSSDAIFITSADPDIEAISFQLSSKISNKPLVFHASGSLSSEILSDLADAGCATGSMHPLVSISDPIRGSERFAGAFFCIEGQNEAVAAAKEMVVKLGGNGFSIETRFKSLYHAAAVTASGHLVALIDIASETLSKCGIGPDEAKRILLPLVKSTVENLENQSNANALTGTFARADDAAFERHLSALSENVPDEVIRIYLELGNRSLDLAESVGQPSESVQKLRKGIKLALGSVKC
jgi:predicted short-subunit dehydrogenase-like oxidoreductase (DUF2520 family)